MSIKLKSQIEGIGTYKLILDTGCHLDLEKCVYVPNCAKNLVSVEKLDDVGFHFKIGNSTFSLYRHKYCYGSGTLMDGLYRFNFDIKYAKSMFHVEHSIGNKHNAHIENSAF